MLAAAADYVEKSNRGDVAACLAMFAPDAVYGSTTVGGHQGIEAISAMMTSFFNKFPAVHWEVQEYALSQVAAPCCQCALLPWTRACGNIECLTGELRAMPSQNARRTMPIASSSCLPAPA